MTFIPKPRVIHPNLPKNKLGLTIRDYEGTMSTLCAGCGHDSVTAAIISAFHELDTVPHEVVKLSGIGCSSKTPTYFVNAAHGFNSAHGRMPSIATGANAANRGLSYIGISGDGDSLSIGLGQLSHAIRRNLNMLYVIENNGVYGLTKGQFSASADVGTKSKKGEANAYSPIDPAILALSLGATFVARSFSGDKKQLVPLIKAGLRHKGFALIDVISPCVTFNDHEGSTKSYKYTRERDVEIVHADFVPHAEEITAEVTAFGETTVTMHDGSVVRFTRVAEGYDPRSRDKAMAYLMEHQKSGKVPTGLLFVDETAAEMHEIAGTVEQPLNQVPFEKLCPGNKALDELQEAFR
ncbi:MAG TPA: 2-oxoacid:ferredoxin oxidoreductase subunit beta [Polyangia bacterium]|jgi:2-oxoglutarate ferredoxin oxidoreductase subunit beta|nr:2-oxoacid:ferredoxin oxidoreductase subunit beta [Polyangia bacterium]